jgi:hypothetical protein
MIRELPFQAGLHAEEAGHSTRLDRRIGPILGSRRRQRIPHAAEQKL